MFGLGLAIKIYIAVEVIYMRKGFEGLHGLMPDHLGQDPLSGHMFLFTNKGKTRLKALVCGLQRRWAGAKRLEKAYFACRKQAAYAARRCGAKYSQCW